MIKIESTIENRFKREMKKMGALCFKWTSPGTRGVPDRIVIFGGRVYFVELKAEGKKPRPNQKVIFEKIKRAGKEVTIISNAIELEIFKKKLGTEDESRIKRLSKTSS